MGLKKHKNRRRADAQHKVASLRRAVGTFAKLLLWTCGLSGLLVAVAIGGYRTYRWAYRAPQLALQEVTFQGLQRAQPADLLRLAGVSAGQNLLGLDPGAIERAMAAHPWVDEVRAARRFPHQLWVRVKEHQPAALVALGDLYLVDCEGRPFKKLESEDPMDFPLITGLSREQFVESPESSRGRLREMIELSSAYARFEPPPAAPLAEIRIARTGVALVAADGQEIWLGDGESTAALSRLGRVRAELQSRGLTAQVIHLENRARPGWVAVKLRPARSKRAASSDE